MPKEFTLSEEYDHMTAERVRLYLNFMSPLNRVPFTKALSEEDEKLKVIIIRKKRIEEKREEKLRLRDYRKERNQKQKEAIAHCRQKYGRHWRKHVRLFFGYTVPAETPL